MSPWFQDNLARTLNRRARHMVNGSSMLASSSSSSLLLSTATPAINAGMAVKDASGMAAAPGFAELLDDVATRTGGKSPSEDLSADPAIAGDPQGSLTIAEMTKTAASAAEAATATGKILPEALPDAVATEAVEDSATDAGEQA